MNKTVYYFIGFFIFLSFSTKGQIIENSLDFGFSGSYNKALGNSYSTVEGFKFVSFYTNFNQIESVSFFVKYKLNHKIKVGFEFENTTFNNWNFPLNNLNPVSFGSQSPMGLSIHGFYFNSSSNQNKFYLTSQYSIFKLSRINFVIHLDPFVGISTTKLPRNIIGIIFTGSQNVDPYSYDFVGGCESSIGMECPIQQYLGISADIGLNKGFTKSTLINDSGYLYSFLRVGLYIRLFRDKNFKYE